jgi:hypothetical protein
VIQCRADHISYDIIDPQLAACCSRGERPQENSVEDGEQHVLRGGEGGIVAEKQPYRAEDVV